jgi:hypothetical protein
MKVIAFSTITSVAFGGIVQMQDSLTQMANSTGSNRDLTAMMGPTLQNINEYGCWCYFEENHGKGKSQPVNEIDAFCKTLHQGYDCAMIDAEEAGTTCVPWEVTYLAANQGNVDVLVNLCNLQNTDDCAIRACIIEGKFVADIFQAFFGGLQLDMSAKHTNGFEVDTQCPTKSGSGFSEKSCCGLYPYRSPFKTYDGNRACCQSRTYDVNVLTCCDDGKARLSC